MKETEFCKCEDVTSIYTEQGDEGYQDMCSKCNKPLEDGFHYNDEPELY